jgi:hypothetical protein
MSLFNLRVIMPATSFALVLLGGGLYEFSVVDPQAWLWKDSLPEECSDKVCISKLYKRRSHLG